MMKRPATRRFPELRVRLVGGDHYISKQPSLVEFVPVKMQHAECDNLKYP